MKFTNRELIVASLFLGIGLLTSGLSIAERAFIITGIALIFLSIIHFVAMTDTIRKETMRI